MNFKKYVKENKIKIEYDITELELSKILNKYNSHNDLLLETYCLSDKNEYDKDEPLTCYTSLCINIYLGIKHEDTITFVTLTETCKEVNKQFEMHRQILKKEKDYLFNILKEKYNTIYGDDFTN